ncbi:uncharacterized protein HKW66_Vig0050330 [Vigna angularis]|uniref:Uncharacterized protein n=1 Tax=Phaseolus angularis TaxID=3914 RepID=A0A8T0L4A1_PHAAN|nr:uncharacterized protein HKW66_Vig0050330 [Vigna angularis]
MKASGHGFIWVVPEKKGKKESEEEKEKWMSKGFEERNVEKWMVIRGQEHYVNLGHAFELFGNRPVVYDLDNDVLFKFSSKSFADNE